MSRSRLLVLAVAAAAALTPLPRERAQSAPAGEWLAGDLHVHTVWGHDTCVTPLEAWDPTKPDFAARVPCEEPYVWGFTPRERLADATERGLHFVALTDHNNLMNLRDDGYREYAGRVLKIPGYESSLAGHAQMIGVERCQSDRGPVAWPVVECDKLVKDRSLAGMRRLQASVHKQGGLFQVNHPSDGNWEKAYGYAFVPDSVEVWSIGPWYWQHPMPASSDNDASLRWWDGHLARGHHVAATGASDSHWRATGTVQGVGQPTTWVYAKARTPAAVVAAIRAGRTVVSHQPPGYLGARIWLEADANRDGTYEAMVGDTVPRSAAVRVRTANVGAGAVLRVVTDAGATELTDLTGTTAIDLGAARRYVRVQLMLPDAIEARAPGCDPVVAALEDASGEEITYCRNRLLMLALTSPVYLR